MGRCIGAFRLPCLALSTPTFTPLVFVFAFGRLALALLSAGVLALALGFAIASFLSTILLPSPGITFILVLWPPRFRTIVILI